MKKNISDFNFKELEGKTLKILVNELEDITIVIGIDTETQDQYILEERETKK